MITNILTFATKDLLNSKAAGTISTLDWDLIVEVEPVDRKSDKSPTHRIFGKSPAGHKVECGAIWLKTNKETGADYYSLNIRGRNFNANLGQAAGQKDPQVQAIIPWE